MLDLDRSFPFHPLERPNDDVTRTGALMRDKFRDTACYVERVLPNSREKSLALTALEEASTWAVKAVYADRVETPPTK